MIFNRLIVSSIIASSALIATVSGTTAPNDAEKPLRELVADLQNRISALEGELAESKTQQGERPRGKTRGGVKNRGVRALDVLEGKGKGGKGKGIKTPDHSICYGDTGEIGAFHVNELFFDGTLARTKIDLGLVELKNDEGLLLEITASSLIVNAIGGEIEQAGGGGGRKLEDIPGVKRDLQGRFYITGSGILMYPIVYVCPETIEQCQTTACIEDICKDDGYIASVEPSAALPLSITIIGGYQENLEGGGGDHFGYEIEAALDITTNSLKFYVPSDDVGGEYLYVDLAFIAATGGIHWDLDFPNWFLEDWTLGAAVLGPHLIEVTKPKAADSECMFFDQFSTEDDIDS